MIRAGQQLRAPDVRAAVGEPRQADAASTRTRLSPPAEVAAGPAVLQVRVQVDAAARTDHVASAALGIAAPALTGAPFGARAIATAAVLSVVREVVDAGLAADGTTVDAPAAAAPPALAGSGADAAMVRVAFQVHAFAAAACVAGSARAPAAVDRRHIGRGRVHATAGVDRRRVRCFAPILSAGISTRCIPARVPRRHRIVV